MHSSACSAASLGDLRGYGFPDEGIEIARDPTLPKPLTSGPVAPRLRFVLLCSQHPPEGSSPVGEFGDKFRKEREKKELSLDDVSRVTKIGTRMLKAIEDEHFDQLPGGVFNRGFIRAYAKHLGLDSEDAINDYQNCLRQTQIDSINAWEAEQRNLHTPGAAQPDAAPAQTSAKVQTPVEIAELSDLQLPRMEDVRAPKKQYLRLPSSIPWLRIALAFCLLMAAVFLWTRYSRIARTSAAPASSTAPQPAPSVAAPPSSQSAQAPAPSPSPTVTPAPTPHAPTESAPSVTTPVATRPPTPPPQPPASADPNTAQTEKIQVEKKGDVTIRSFGAAAAAVLPEKPAPALTLIVRASENSWISVTSDGQLVTQETLIAPAATSFRASRELVVRVGNAAAVTFLWNGEEFPPQGAEAEAKTFIFDAQGMRAVAPSPQN